MKRFMIFITILGLTFLFSFEGYKLYKNLTEEKITVVVLECEHSILHIPMYIALKEKFFNDHNMKVSFRSLPPEGLEGVLEKTPPDILLGETVQCLFSRPCNIRNNWMCFASATCCSGYFLLARESMPDFQWENIKGKTVIAGPPDNSGELVLESIARNMGMRPQYGFTVLWNIPENLKAGALAAGTSTYILLKEPLVTIEECKGTAAVVSSLGKDGGYLPEVVFLARKDFAERNTEVMQNFTDSIYKAQIWMQHHSAQETAEKTRGYFPHLDKETLKQSIDRHLVQGTWSKTPEINQDAYEKLQTITKQCGELYCTVDYRDEADNRFALRSIASVEYIPKDKEEKKYPQDFFRVLFE